MVSNWATGTWGFSPIRHRPGAVGKHSRNCRAVSSTVAGESFVVVDGDAVVMAGEFEGDFFADGRWRR